MNDMSTHGSNAVRFDVSQDSSPAQAAPRRVRRRQGENRERLLRAGIIVFGNHGYHGAQTAGIAALADVPQPHVYANFSTKQELFLACAERVCEALESTVLAPGSDQDEAAYGMFLLQCVAAFAEPKLQPELGALLEQLRKQIGAQRVLDLICASVSVVLHE